MTSLAKNLKYSESSRTKGSFIPNTDAGFQFDQLAQKETIPSADHLELVLKGLNLLIQGSLHDSALYFRVWVGRMIPVDQTVAPLKRVTSLIRTSLN